MAPVYQGVLIGLALTLLVGPLVLTLVQTRVTQGVRAGLVEGAGIWTSDLFLRFVLVLA